MGEPVVLERKSADDDRLQAVLAAFRLGYLAGIEDAGAPSAGAEPHGETFVTIGDSR